MPWYNGRFYVCAAEIPQGAVPVETEVKEGSQNPVSGGAVAQELVNFEQRGGYVTPQMYQAAYEGEADDTALFNAMLQDAAAKKKSVLLPEGDYTVGTIDVPAGVCIYGASKVNSRLRADKINLSHRNTLRDFTILTGENATDLIHISSDRLIENNYFAQMTLKDLRVMGVTPEKIGRAPNAIAIEVASNYTNDGIYGITIDNVCTERKLNYGIVFRQIYNADNWCWITNIKVDNCFFDTAKWVFKQEVTFTDEAYRKRLTPLSGLKASFVNGQSDHLNDKTVEGYADFYYINFSDFNSCALWDREGEKLYQFSEYDPEHANVINVYNDYSTGYAGVVHIVGCNKTPLWQFTTVVSNYSNIVNQDNTLYQGFPISAKENKHQDDAPRNPLYRCIGFVDGTDTRGREGRSFYGMEYYDYQEMQTYSTPSILGFDNDHNPVYAVKKANDEGYVLKELLTERDMPRQWVWESPNRFDKGTMVENGVYFTVTNGKVKRNIGSTYDIYGGVTVPVSGPSTVTMSYDTDATSCYCGGIIFLAKKEEGEEEGRVISNEALNWEPINGAGLTIDVPAGAVKMLVNIANYNDTTKPGSRTNLMIVAGDKAMPYQAYTGTKKRVTIPGLMLSPSDKAEATLEVDKAQFDDRFLFIASTRLQGIKYWYNSASHFKRCAKMDYTALHGTVAVTKDGKLVMDDYGGFTFNEDGKIVAYNNSNKTSIRDLTEAECLSYQYQEAGDYVCGFEQYVRICKRYGKVAFVTITNKYLSALVPELMRVLKKYGMLKRCIISSVSEAALKTVREADPTVMLSLALERSAALTQMAVDKAVKLGNCILCGWHFDAVKTDAEIAAAIDTSVVEYAAEMGVRVYEREIHSMAMVDKLMECGITGVVLDVTPSDE